MSGIAGIYNMDGRPADASLLRRMTDVISHRGPDDVGHWVRGSVGLGHRMLHTTPESLLEQQPLADESGTFCLTFDGRVDNREELRQALEAKGARLRTDTDAELVLRAYECWGKDCPQKILGDFAFVIWDSRQQHLFCARDIQGLKPFYYFWNERMFLFASELHQILEDPGVPREPNEGMVGEYLMAMPTNLEETLYHGIFRLPRAHTLTVRAGQVRKECYWDINWDREIHYRTDQEYADNYFEIFKEAVRCRLRSHRLIGAELSGGLDSSSVVSMAQWLFREGAVDGPGFETFSLVYPGQSYDESPYIREVVQRWGVRSNEVPEKHPQTSTLREQACRYRDFPGIIAPELLDPAMLSIQNKGGRVVLTGNGGDNWLTGSPLYIADLLCRRRFLDAVRQSKLDSRIFGQQDTKCPSPLYMFLRYGLFPLLPRLVQRGAQRVLKRDGNEIPRWIGPEFARRFRLATRLRGQELSADRCASIVRRQFLAPILNYPLYCLIDRYISGFGLEYRYPFLDRRLVEFCLALPQEQIRHNDQTKFILRQAMRGLLPEMVRTRLTKARYGAPAYRNAIEDLGGEQFFDSLAIASLGWVDRKQVQQMYRHMATHFDQNDYLYATYLMPLWYVGGIELWFRTVFLNGTIPTQENAAIGRNGQSRKETRWERPQEEEMYSSANRS